MNVLWRTDVQVCKKGVLFSTCDSLTFQRQSNQYTPPFLLWTTWWWLSELPILKTVACCCEHSNEPSGSWLTEHLSFFSRKTMHFEVNYTRSVTLDAFFTSSLLLPSQSWHRGCFWLSHLTSRFILLLPFGTHLLGGSAEPKMAPQNTLQRVVLNSKLYSYYTGNVFQNE
jgi:hypothetical protein